MIERRADRQLKIESHATRKATSSSGGFFVVVKICDSTAWHSELLGSREDIKLSIEELNFFIS